MICEAHWRMPFLRWCATASALGAILMTVLVCPERATAQDEFDQPAAKEAPATGSAVETPTDQPPPEINVLKWTFRSLGISYSLVFLTLSIILVALFVMILLSARRENVCPTYLIDAFEQHLSQKQYQEAYDLAKGDDSFLGHVLSAGLAKLSSGYAHAIEAMQEVGEEENMKLEHRLSYLALIGNLSPMIGLFGTVHGMITSFSVIANSSTTPKPSELAGGISTAMFTTLVGLLIAIPAIAMYSILKNRISRLVLEVGIVSEGLMDRFQNVGERKKA